MTIKEIEAMCEMTRANIRFYESEGLLTPARNQNGYRDYSHEDAEVLKRIRLLRTLHISLEEIKALHSGEQELTEVLERQLKALEAQQADLKRSGEICRVMRNDNVRYESLDAQRYLNEMQTVSTQTAEVPELVEDILPKERIPWRRFWARHLDLVLYSALWTVLLVAVGNVNPGNRGIMGSFLDDIMGIALLLLLEPAFLALFGTTPGKWILGLRVLNAEEGRLSYSEAFSRTWLVFWKGMGFFLPIYNIYRLWKSYVECGDGEKLEWEEDSSVLLQDKKRWRVALLAVVYVGIFGILFWTIASAQMPKHRGELTVVELSENYNRLAEYYGLDANYRLSSGGAWVKQWGSTGVTVHIGYVERPELVFWEENGIVTGVEFALTLDNHDGWPPSYQEVMLLLAMSFVCAQEECDMFSKEREELLQLIQDSAFESYAKTVFEVDVNCEVAYSGYEGSEYTMIGLWPVEGADKWYEISFSMKKNS